MHPLHSSEGFPDGTMVENPPAVQKTEVMRVRSLGWGRSPREGNGNPLQYSFPENPMDRGAWQATVHGVTKSQTRLSNFTSLHFTSLWIIEKAKEFQETSISALLTMPKPLTVWITTNCGKF